MDLDKYIEGNKNINEGNKHVLFFFILFKEQPELLGNFLHFFDSPDRSECCGLMPFVFFLFLFLIRGQQLRISPMTAKESEQDKKGKFPLVTFIKLQASLQILETFIYFMILQVLC